MKLGPRPLGGPWTPALLALLASKTEAVLIARKLKRTMAAIRKRKSVLKAKVNGTNLTESGGNFDIPTLNLRLGHKKLIGL
jgi:hypothetical protein